MNLGCCRCSQMWNQPSSKLKPTDCRRQNLRLFLCLPVTPGRWTTLLWCCCCFPPTLLCTDSTLNVTAARNSVQLQNEETEKSTVSPNHDVHMRPFLADKANVFIAYSRDVNRDELELGACASGICIKMRGLLSQFVHITVGCFTSKGSGRFHHCAQGTNELCCSPTLWFGSVRSQRCSLAETTRATIILLAPRVRYVFDQHLAGRKDPGRSSSAGWVTRFGMRQRGGACVVIRLQPPAARVSAEVWSEQSSLLSPAVITSLSSPWSEISSSKWCLVTGFHLSFCVTAATQRASAGIRRSDARPLRRPSVCMKDGDLDRDVVSHVCLPPSLLFAASSSLVVWKTEVEEAVPKCHASTFCWVVIFMRVMQMSLCHRSVLGSFLFSFAAQILCLWIKKSIIVLIIVYFNFKIGSWQFTDKQKQT